MRVAQQKTTAQSAQRTKRSQMFFRYVLCVFASFALLTMPAAAQAPPCGYVDALDFPVDPALFTLAQDYGAPSPRHQGRYHTGEDWTLRDDPARSEGQFVRAIADGRVLYSSPNGWGGDGGVIMVEHSFPDDSIATSLYGHLTDATGVQFPAVYACVKRGDILAAIGDVRPAPHVHIEIRAEASSTPGAGYSWDNPTVLGHRRPSKFILNWQLWLSDAYRWHLDLGDETGAAAPPVRLEDESLIYVDRDRLARVNPNGGVLWRVNLDARPLWIYLGQVNASVALSSGEIVTYAPDGSAVSSWNAGEPLRAALPGYIAETTAGDWIEMAQSSPVWRESDMPPIAELRFTNGGIVIRTTDNQMITLDPSGGVLDRAQLREAASLALDADGVPLVYSRGGLWRIENQTGDVVWTPALTFAPAGGARSAVHADADGYTLFDGERLLRYRRDGGALWATPFAASVGAAQLQRVDSYYLLTTNDGDIAAFRVTDGALCNQARAFGDGRSRMWASVGTDGLLRAHVADQIVALDWRDFLGACA